MNEFLKRLLRPIERRLEGNDSLKRIALNTGWMFADKIVRMIAGLLVGVWVARYLGPENFGSLSWATAITSLFAPLAGLGLDSIVIRDIVRDEEHRNEILGTAFYLKMVAGIATVVCTLATVFIIRPDDGVSHWLVGLIGAGVLFQSLDVMDFWFQSQMLSKYTVIAKGSAFLVLSLVKVALILSHAPVVAFAATALAEIALGAFGLWLVYHRVRLEARHWVYRGSRAKAMLKDSWPLVVSGLVTMIYLRVDQVLVGGMRGDKDVGIYSVAVRIGELWYFIPLAITSSVFPAIVEAKKIGERLYLKRLEKLFLLVFWLALIVAVPLSLFSGTVITLVFGAKYAAAAPVLSIHIWSGIFVFMGLVSNHWYLLENLNHYTLYRHIVGATVNVVLNLFLIQKFGIIGPAIATLLTQFSTSYMFDLLNRPTRPLFWMKTRIFLYFVPDTLKYLAGYRQHGHADDGSQE
jgi:PST family polysaccharide transporter